MRIGRARFTWYDLVLAGLAFLVMAGTTIWLILHYGALPDKVPTHFNISGEIDGYSGKSTLWVLMGIGWVVWFLMALPDFFPKLWSTSITVKPQYEAKLRSWSKTFMHFTQLFIAALFSFMTIWMPTGKDYPVWFMPVVIAVILLPAVALTVISIKWAK